MNVSLQNIDKVSALLTVKLENVSLQNIDKVSALLTVKLEKADYQEKVDKSLKSFRQKAQIPGFRKGMVPMSLVKKMYGKSALAEEVNKLLSETVYKYIQYISISRTIR